MEPVTRAQAGFQVPGKRDRGSAVAKRRRADPGLTPLTTADRGRDGYDRPPFRVIRALAHARQALLAAICGLCPGLACTPTVEVPAVEVQPSAAAESLPELPAASDTVVIALRRLPVTLDPTAELDPWGQRIVDDLLFEGLTHRLPDAPWAEPALAERCVVHGEGRSVACKLRPGAIRCTRNSSSASNTVCSYTRSECTDGKTYAITCNAGMCTCSTDGANGATFQDSGFCNKSSQDRSALLKSSCNVTVF